MHVFVFVCVYLAGAAFSFLYETVWLLEHARLRVYGSINYPTNLYLIHTNHLCIVIFIVMWLQVVVMA